MSEDCSTLCKCKLCVVERLPPINSVVRLDDPTRGRARLGVGVSDQLADREFVRGQLQG